MPGVEDKTQQTLDENANGAKDGDADAGSGSDDGASSANGDVGGKSGDGSKFSVEEILDEYGLDSAEDLKEFMAHMNDLKGQIGDNDLEELIENANTLKTYQKQWAIQEEEKRREKETPEETIARLENENKNLKTNRQKDAERMKASKEAERAIKDFNDTIKSVVKNANEIPTDYRPFVNEFLGVNNPINDVDITDKAALRRVGKSGLKKIQAFEQAVIKRYRAGKIKIPKIGKTETTPADSGVQDRKPKNLKEAKKIMMESVEAFTRGQ